MEYAIVIILVVLVVTIGVTIGVMRATRTRQEEGAAQDSEEGGTPGDEMAIVAPDSETPLGDTKEHAGDQTREGTTAGDPDSERRAARHNAAEHSVPPVGGEQPAGEGEGARPL